MRKKNLHLLAFYSRVPKNPKQSHKKDFGKKEDNWSTNESVHFTLGLKDKDLIQAGIILDLTEQKVIKCTMNPDLGFMQLFSYFKQNYPQYIKVLNEAMYGEQETEETKEEISNDAPVSEDTDVSVQASQDEL